MDDSGNLVGLIAAGTENYIIANPIQDILNGLFSESELVPYDQNERHHKESRQLSGVG